ncbi:armadillo interacting protein [Cystoisospora suis]|uniref:Armadillo interacting protein n=1 Tax=Cystoisospora suis TaxID=483139 RepID=A0A2C6KGM9_9APIC|nr:armadillo interacting protein [Cystoisospora suis]
MKDTRRRPSIARRRVRIKRLEGGSGSLVKRTSSYRPKGGGGEGGGGLKGGLRKKLSKAGSVVYIDDSSAASGEGKKKSILKRVGSARSVTQKDSLEDDVDHSSSSSTSHDSDDEDDTKNGGNVKRKEEEGDVVEERSLCRKSKGSIRLDGSAVTRSESGLKKTKKGSNRSRSTGASFSDEDEDAHRVEGEDDDEEVESHCKDQSTSGPSSRSCQGGSRGEGEDRRKDVDALEEDDEGEKESRQALMASSDPSSVDHQQSKTAREISSTQSEELGEIRRQLMKAQSAQQQKDSTGTLSMNGAERDGVEEKIRRRSSSSRNVNSSSLSPLHSDSLSSRQVDDLLDHGDIVCGMNNSRSPPVGSNRGGRGGSSSTSSGKAAGIQASRSKRGSVIGGGAGVTKKLSKYKTLNRVPPAQPEGNETPLLTPGEMTPRDPESERPMFG